MHREKVLLFRVFSGSKSHPASGWLRPVAIEATRGGEETVGAFETDGSLWRLGELTDRNSQLTLSRHRKVQCGRRPCVMMGNAAAAGYRETIGIDRPTSGQGPAGHRGIDDGMSANGETAQHGKPKRRGCVTLNRTPVRDRPVPFWVAERSVVPAKLRNAGGEKGPWFQVNVISERHPGD